MNVSPGAIRYTSISRGSQTISILIFMEISLLKFLSRLEHKCLAFMSTIVRTRIEEIREKEIYMGKWCFKNVFKYLFFSFFRIIWKVSKSPSSQFRNFLSFNDFTFKEEQKSRFEIHKSTTSIFNDPINSLISSTLDEGETKNNRLKVTIRVPSL